MRKNQAFARIFSGRSPEIAGQFVGKFLSVRKTPDDERSRSMAHRSKNRRSNVSERAVSKTEIRRPHVWRSGRIFGIQPKRPSTIGTQARRTARHEGRAACGTKPLGNELFRKSGNFSNVQILEPKLPTIEKIFYFKAERTSKNFAVGNTDEGHYERKCIVIIIPLDKNLAFRRKMNEFRHSEDNRGYRQDSDDSQIKARKIHSGRLWITRKCRPFRRRLRHQNKRGFHRNLGR